MKFVANPVEVEASVITHVYPPDLGGGQDLVIDGTMFHADAGMLARYRPGVGDYLVTQSDGYRYVNPKAVFERKYSPIGAVPEDRFKVEKDHWGCPECGASSTYAVVDKVENTNLSTWDDQEVADDICGWMNRAYRKGLLALTVVRPAGESTK